VCCATTHLGGKMTKSATAVPGMGEGAVSTVKIDGSGWSKLTALTAVSQREHKQV
jgi:hypothetical protein